MLLMEHAHSTLGVALPETYNVPLIVLSVFIAILSSFTAFGTAERQYNASKISLKIAWNIFGATAMGLGVWAMHFIGMLAFSLPVPISYDVLPTVVSIFPAIAACSMTLWMLTQRDYSHIRLIIAGVILGSGIGLMHYIGMSAMRMNAVMMHDMTLFYLSIAAAIILATVAIKVNGRVSHQVYYHFISKRHIVSAVVMGLATSSMHYIAMASAQFYPQTSTAIIGGMNSHSLAIIVSIVVMLILLFALVIPYFLRYKQMMKALSSNLKRLSLALSVAKQGWYDLELQTEVITVSDDYARLLGYELAEYNTFHTSFESWKNAIHPDDVDAAMDAIQRTVQGNEPIEHEYRRKNKAGDWIWLHSIGEVVERDNDHKPIRIIGISTNITEHKQSEQVLRLLAESDAGTGEETIFQLIVKELASSQNVRYVFLSRLNPLAKDQVDVFAGWAGNQYCEPFSYSLANTPCEKVTEQGICSFPDNVQALFPHDHILVEMGVVGYQGIALKNSQNELIGLLVLLDDKPMIEQVNTSSLLHSVAVRAAIELERIESNKQLKLMAHYDVLTQLPNRSLFADRFIHAVAHSKRNDTLLAICFLDLDNFKPVNDLYGHEVGDQLLIEVAKRIRAEIREEDTVSRQGGDEFALLLMDLNAADECTPLLNRLHQSLARPYIINGQPIIIGASSGVTVYPTDDSDIDTLLRHADQAMYQAKLAGKNRHLFFNAEHDLQTIAQQSQLQDIQQALINDEFALYYQPKVNMATGKVFGVEALIRWRHPEKGLIPPLDFLPIIEGTHLEIQIGDWVINEALSQMAVWQTQAIDLEVSVNVSSYHLQYAHFIDQLDVALTNVPSVNSNRFQLEILESSALGDIKTINHIIKNCRDSLGINAALDDFGTGYSSLTHLRSLAINTIKIDQSFVRDMLDDPSDYAIIDGVIGLADSFNKNVIAEGVETTEHGLMLLIMGCHEAQGYGIARPMPGSEVADWLANYEPNPQWLSAAKQSLTVKETQLHLFKLVTNQWQAYFEQNIMSSPEDIQYWPIMAKTKCPCGSWIGRAKKTTVFNKEWLIKLEQAHEDLHLIANDLLLKYQNDELAEARSGLSEFHAGFDRVSEIINTEMEMTA